MSPRAILAAAALLLAAMALAATPSRAQVPILASVSGPSALAPSQIAAYNLTLTGGPDGRVSYTVTWYVTGADVSGALPTQSSPSSTNGNRTAFRLNITAPPRETGMTLFVSVRALVGTTSENTSVEKAITVVTPIVLSATFRNDASTSAVNVTVRFYVDDAFVGSVKASIIGPHSQATESFNYLPVGLQPGLHKVRIEADLDGNGVIDPARGEAVVSDLFYRYTPAPSTAWTVLIGIAVFLPVLLVTMALRRRERT